MMEQPQEELGCFLCLRRPCISSCDKCPVSFCSNAHRLLHQDERGQCFPYQIEHREGVGRCLVATRHLDPGSLVFREEPVLVGPLHETRPVCLGCFTPCKSKCHRCQLPLCTLTAGKTCTWRDLHLQLECQVMAQLKSSSPQDNDWDKDEPHPLFQCILPLRCLLIKDSRPEHWAAIQAMMDHVEEKRHEAHWRDIEENVVRYLLGTCQLGNRFTQQEVDHVVGVLEVNAFEVTSQDGGRGRGLYPLTALMSHGCLSNTRYIFNSAQCVAECRTNVGVKTGEELLDHYVSPLNGTLWRKKKLREGWCFDCRCQRCADPTELSTNFSSAICQSCTKGTLLLPKRLLTHSVAESEAEANEAATCQSCGQYKSVAELRQTEQQLESLLELTQNNKEALQKILASYSHVLHPNHYLLISAKRYLLYQYSPSDPRRVNLAKEILSVYDVIDPGLTKERGLTLFEIHQGLLRTVKKDLEQPISASDAMLLRKKIEEVIELGLSARECLEYEREDTFEGTIRKTVENTLRLGYQLQESLTSALQ